MSIKATDSNTALCVVCNKSLEITNFYYCLCDAPVCSSCIKGLKINDKEWKCPKCSTVVDLESSQLFRERD